MKTRTARFMAAAALSALVASAASPALAQALAGATGEGRTPLTSVADVLKNKTDDYPVVITGTIVKKTGDEKYEFKDETGAIQAEIDDEDLYNITVDGAKVTLTGEIDIEGDVVEIDADTVAKVE